MTGKRFRFFCFVTGSIVLPVCAQIKAGIPVKQQKKEKLQTSAYCYNCAKRGHHGYVSASVHLLSLPFIKYPIATLRSFTQEWCHFHPGNTHVRVGLFFLTCDLSVCLPQMCTKQRMYNGTYPNTPFINHYDTAEDMKRREHRIKLKVRGEPRPGANAQMSNLYLLEVFVFNAKLCSCTLRVGGSFTWKPRFPPNVWILFLARASAIAHKRGPLLPRGTVGRGVFEHGPIVHPCAQACHLHNTQNAVTKYEPRESSPTMMNKFGRLGWTVLEI